MSERCSPAVKAFCQKKLPPPLSSRRHTISHLPVSTLHTPKIVSDLHKLSPTCVLADRPDDTVALGSFTPTDPASMSLRSLAASKLFKLSPVEIRRRRQQRPPLPVWPINFDVRSLDSPSSSTLNSPLSPVPSISRTSSTYSPPDTPSSPTGSSIVVPLVSQPEEKIMTTELSPTLASLEWSSKICTQLQYCAVCKKPGKNYPKCRKCGELWCSRECRLHDNSKKHLCSGKG